MTALRNTQPVDVAGGDPAEGRWSQAEMLLAALCDAVKEQTWLWLSAHTPQGSPPPKKPDPIPRPGAATGKSGKRLSSAAYERLYAHINGLPGGPRLRLVKDGKGRNPGG